MRAAAAWHDSQAMKIARLGDNMREVAVTEGDKVEAQIRFGVAVNGYGLGDLVAFQDQVTDAEVDQLCQEYADSYTLMAGLEKGGARHESLRDAARIELALRAFLADGGFHGYTDTFENLHGLKQLPGIPSQRLMADGYGFGAEGDWKHAALVRSMKVMAHGLEGRHLLHGGLHLSLRSRRPGGARRPHAGDLPLDRRPESPPARSIRSASAARRTRSAWFSIRRPGDAVNASIVDMGNRFRMIVNTLEVIPPHEKLPKLPVARALWVPQPNLATAAAAWIHAGGAHHTGFSLALSPEHLEDFAAMAKIEYLLIDSETKLREFRNELRWNEAAYVAAPGLH